MSKVTKNQRISTLERQLSALMTLVKMKGYNEPEPQLKQLDQSIFNGLDEKWRFAAVDADGSANGFDIRVYPRGGDEYGLFAYESDYANSDDNSVHIGKGYDASNWQNSLIERDTAKELLEVDLSSELTGSELCKAMLARGDKCVLIRMGVRDDKQAKDIGRFAIATSIDESGRFNVMSDQQPISKVDFAVPINNQGEPLTAAEVGL